MYDTIKELWYGKLQPWEKHITDNDKINELCKKLDQLEESVRAQLGANEHLVTALTKTYFELTEVLGADAFVKGFRLGGRFCADIFK